MSPFEHGEVFVLDDGGEVSTLNFGIIEFTSCMSCIHLISG